MGALTKLMRVYRNSSAGTEWATSATLVDPLGWLCDRLATALMVAGEDGAKYFAPA
jgi:thiamine biosynthesis lipoprotein ApbE